MNSRALLVATMLTLCAAALWGCGSSEEARDDRTPRRVRAMDSPDPGSTPSLAPDAPDVATVQLHVTGSEIEPPILDVGRGGTLDLSFDLLALQGRPVSVYFYHADREWRRDLTPSEYLLSFQRDNILDYASSQATEVPYIHYRYRFPNSTIQFALSGNYVVRVTEQGDEEAVLLERPFYLSEAIVPVDLLLDDVFVRQSSFPATQPTAAFTPPSQLQANVFDYSVCFSRDGRLMEARCATEPSLMNQPSLSFFLRPSSSFVATGSDYVLDLSLLQAGGKLEGLDVTSSPFAVRLAPDLARFGADDLEPHLFGQAAVASAVRDAPDPDLQAEYVRVMFSLVVDGDRPLPGDIFVVGPFTGWRATEAGRMRWNSENSRYEATMLVKQGRYEYRYVSRNAAAISALNQSLPRPSARFTALVYYRDARLQTDRIVGVGRRQAF